MMLSVWVYEPSSSRTVVTCATHDGASHGLSGREKLIAFEVVAHAQNTDLTARPIPRKRWYQPATPDGFDSSSVSTTESPSPCVNTSVSAVEPQPTRVSDAVVMRRPRITADRLVFLGP